MGFELDHTSFAVADALAHAGRLRRELGAVPIAGEELPEFRYLLLYVGTVDRGARIELIEPTGPGFLSRFLDASGEGPHHITIAVPDLAEAVRRTRALGLTVVGESHEHAGWREAFVMPDDVHGTVIQLASSDRRYPSVDELLSTRSRDMSSMPAVAGAWDPHWWTSLWEIDPVDQSGWLGATHLRSTNLGLSREFFGTVLEGDLAEEEGGFRVTWPSGAIRVLAGEPVGITRVERHGGAGGDWTIGCCGFTADAVTGPR